ncbi:transmembrane protein, putative (macronuclear) [Tetrahymena thermophila SB210]|uniref:Transmembrane protein, putative n=1 Tax=Tetrahymena thermophila (strain SB210) TaxID=312017 RepID=W7XKD3_TETTS|nr:transmembrane protein, putative [Tetrahymena thermophila SB210]EWS76431.1 transmembrane protein, putative [Tetrahymena thermophila SB210]|eukprot:XP_012651055.1 transmembrane protein, putative [Tetrahymena thermophila SB210]
MLQLKKLSYNKNNSTIQLINDPFLIQQVNLLNNQKYRQYFLPFSFSFFFYISIFLSQLIYEILLLLYYSITILYQIDYKTLQLKSLKYLKIKKQTQSLISSFIQKLRATQTSYSNSFSYLDFLDRKFILLVDISYFHKQNPNLQALFNYGIQKKCRILFSQLIYILAINNYLKNSFLLQIIIIVTFLLSIKQIQLISNIQTQPYYEQVLLIKRLIIYQSYLTFQHPTLLLHCHSLLFSLIYLIKYDLLRNPKHQLQNCQESSQKLKMHYNYLIQNHFFKDQSQFTKNYF